MPFITLYLHRSPIQLIYTASCIRVYGLLFSETGAFSLLHANHQKCPPLLFSPQFSPIITCTHRMTDRHICTYTYTHRSWDDSTASLRDGHLGILKSISFQSSRNSVLNRYLTRLLPAMIIEILLVVLTLDYHGIISSHFTLFKDIL